MVTTGRSLTGTDFNKAIEAYKKMHKKCEVNLCASHGFLTEVEFIRLKEAGVVSIPINVLMPIKGTLFDNLERICREDILRTIAIFRYLNPTAYIRMAAGRNYFADGGTKLFQSGANATITNNMLTTVGNNTEQDKIMLTKLSFNIQK